MLGLVQTGTFRSERENVDEDILAMGKDAFKVEVDIMQPLDIDKKPAVHTTPLNHIGLWIDDLPKAVEWLTAQGVRFAPGGIRKERSVDAGLPARLGRFAARRAGQHRAHARGAACVWRYFAAHFLCQPGGYAHLPGHWLPAGVVAGIAACALGQCADDSGAGAVLDIDFGAGCRLDCAAAVRRLGQPGADGAGHCERAAGLAVQPHGGGPIACGAHSCCVHRFCLLYA
ncbi:hypothetical protein FQA39_LY18807 [Lamprigera yunnana]|nr:hypothetical protein FQA39_LY18807 [Lamprigera yunnana]